MALPGHDSYTGHVAIVVAPGLTIGTSDQQHKISLTNWGFRNGQQEKVVFRRYVGKPEKDPQGYRPVEIGEKF